MCRIELCVSPASRILRTSSGDLPCGTTSDHKSLQYAVNLSVHVHTMHLRNLNNGSPHYPVAAAVAAAAAAEVVNPNWWPPC